METLYDTLEVSRKASKEVIEKAYKTLAKRYHPDVQTPENKAHAEEMMKKINEAYDILSDEQKRSKYDEELAEQEKIENEKNNYQSNINQDNWNNADNSYQDYSKLSKREQAKVRKKIEKEASNEYRKMYENYFRSLGYKIKHKWTFKDYVTLFIVIAALILIFMILWWIPQTHNWMLETYNNNLIVKIIVNIIIGIGKGIAQFFKNIFKF